MKSLTTVQKAFLALIVANIIWGAAAPIFKLSLENIPLYTLAFWRFFLGALILLAVFRKKMTLTLKSRRDAVFLVAYALLGITLNIIFFFEGLKLTLSINSPIIASGQPIMTMLFALLFLHETFHPKKFLGMLLGTIGIIVIIIEPLLLTGVNGSVLGNLLLVIATVAAVGQTIVGKQVIEKYNPFAFTFWAFLIGAASFFPMMIREYISIPNLYPLLDWRGYLGIFYGAVFSSATAYSLFAWGLSKIDATDTAIFSYVDPIVGTILGAWLLSEPISVPFIVGSILIFGGIFVAEGRIHYHPIRKIMLLGKPIREIPIPVVDSSSKLNKKKVLASIFRKT
jgi:drug/metabolite transporter (DMT)-like permease